MPKLNILTNHKNSLTPIFNATQAQKTQSLPTRLNQPVTMKIIKTISDIIWTVHHNKFA